MQLQALPDTIISTAPGDFFSNPQRKKDLLKAFLHAADLYNPFKPFPIAYEWAVQLQQEFDNQTRHEEQEGLPWLPFMRKQTPEVFVSSQIGFVTTICLPYWGALARLFPSLTNVTDMLNRNLEHWALERNSPLSDHV